MKKILKLSGILSWINLVAGSLLVVGGIMGTVLSPDIFTILLSIVLPGSVILHSSAALQLRKSMLNTSIPLNKQAPAGIRLMGFMALFFAIMSISNGILILQHAPEAAKLIKLPVQVKDMNIIPILRASGVFTLVISVSILANVILNFRLMRWYLFYRDNEAK
jgi:hypothetical protein